MLDATQNAKDEKHCFPDRALAQLGAKRRVALSLPFFVPAIFAIAQTDLILTVPRKLAQIKPPWLGYSSWNPLARSKLFHISWPGIRDSLLNLRMHGFASNYRMAARAT